MTPSYRTEFPDYDPATMPEIPEAFEDSSWHNDVCPSFICEAVGLHLWADYADPDLSESAMLGKRFALLAMDPDPEGWQMPDDYEGACIVEADDFAVMLATLPKVAEWFEDRAEIAQTAANHAAGTDQGAELQREADALRERAAKAAEVFGDQEAGQ